MSGDVTGGSIPIAALDAMDRAALTRLWTGLFGSAVPKSVSQQLLRRFIAFELQARRSGGLPKGFVEILTRRVAAEGAAHRAAATPGLKPGGRLLREWAGVTHVVEVVEGGYLWRGTRHRSLSAIAQAITGAHWSGPRFFGLTAQNAEAGKAGRTARRATAPAPRNAGQGSAAGGETGPAASVRGGRA